MSFLFRCLTFRAGMFPELSKQWVPGSPNSRKAMRFMLARMPPATVKHLCGIRRGQGDGSGLKPKSIDHVHAAAIPVVALTAWQALFDKAGLSKSQRILIHGAAGGVGSLAVQLAKWKGAHVIGTAS